MPATVLSATRATQTEPLSPTPVVGLDKKKEVSSADKEKELTPTPIAALGKKEEASSTLEGDLKRRKGPLSPPVVDLEKDKELSIAEKEEASSALEADLETRKGASSLLIANLDKVSLATNGWTTTFLTQSKSTQSKRCNEEGVQKESMEKLAIQDTGERGGLRVVPPGGNKLVFPITSSVSVTSITSTVRSNTATSGAAQIQPLTLHGSQESNERQVPSTTPPEMAASKQVKKQLLLAKLMAIDSGVDPNKVCGGDQREPVKQELGWEMPHSSTTTVAKQPNHGQNDAAVYRPSFGRRACAAELKTVSPRTNQSNMNATPSLFSAALHQSPHSTPLPRQPNTESKRSSVFGDGSTHLTLQGGVQVRPAAMATKDIIPGAITAEPEDLEELTL